MHKQQSHCTFVLVMYKVVVELEKSSCGLISVEKYKLPFPGKDSSLHHNCQSHIGQYIWDI